MTYFITRAYTYRGSVVFVLFIVVYNLACNIACSIIIELVLTATVAKRLAYTDQDEFDYLLITSLVKSCL